MTKQEAIDHFGSTASLAKALKISFQAVHGWGDKIPYGRQFQIQILTKGKLKASDPSVAKATQPGHAEG